MLNRRAAKPAEEALSKTNKKGFIVVASRPLCVLSASAVLSSPEPDPSEPTPLLERIDCGHFHPFRICPKCGRGHGWKIHLQPGVEGKFVPAPSPEPTTPQTNPTP